ncbi:MAG: hypothetical protein PCALPYG88_4011 [uncultured Paraburkholderia sp.]|nr:MAG: hypothetical protein PCALPYG08_4208 [uncultured Paraburkholderia sp.]CAH2927515.1 MAG: hypothetical protein PCALPYG88_4011 [uncultured Paraburkholderia sp.]
MFNHKRCNLPATYASGIGLPAQTLTRFVRRFQRASHAAPFAHAMQVTFVTPASLTLLCEP